jgi:hypothetical protein
LDDSGCTATKCGMDKLSQVLIPSPVCREGCLGAWLLGWLSGCLAVWPSGCLAACLPACLSMLLLAGWLAARLVFAAYPASHTIHRPFPIALPPPPFTTHPPPTTLLRRVAWTPSRPISKPKNAPTNSYARGGLHPPRCGASQNGLHLPDGLFLKMCRVGAPRPYCVIARLSAVSILCEYWTRFYYLIESGWTGGGVVVILVYDPGSLLLSPSVVIAS